jgi:hypothetical protein
MWKSKMPETVEEALAPIPGVVENLVHVMKTTVKQMYGARNEAHNLRRRAEHQDTLAEELHRKAKVAMVLKEKFEALTTVTDEELLGVEVE